MVVPREAKTLIASGTPGGPLWSPKSRLQKADEPISVPKERRWRSQQKPLLNGNFYGPLAAPTGLNRCSPRSRMAGGRPPGAPRRGIKNLELALCTSPMARPRKCSNEHRTTDARVRTWCVGLLALSLQISGTELNARRRPDNLGLRLAEGRPRAVGLTSQECLAAWAVPSGRRL
jgi:hypothetical protein